MPKQIESLKSLSLELAKICKTLHKPTPETKQKKRQVKKIIKSLFGAPVSKYCLTILEEDKKNSPDVKFLLWSIVRTKGIRFALKIFRELRRPLSFPELNAKIAKLRREAKQNPGIASLYSNEIKEIQEKKKEALLERAHLLLKIKSAIIDYLGVELESKKDRIMLRELQKISAF